MVLGSLRFALVTGLIASSVVLRIPLTVMGHEHCICGACCNGGFSETATKATLRNLWSAQEQFREAKSCDEDGDGKGEAGGFGELSGAVGVRGGANTSPVLSKRFTKLRYGCVERNGYYYRIFLPARGGGVVGELEGGGFPAGTVDPGRAASSWFAYAWPVREEHRGHRTFFMFADGEMLATTGYAAGDAPRPDAALDAKGQPAIDTIGSDGNSWRQCG